MEKLTMSQKYLKNQDKFRYFIEQYFPNKTVVLDEMAREGRNIELSTELTNIWFLLPDNQFNIIADPPGWNEFLQVIEA